MPKPTWTRRPTKELPSFKHSMSPPKTSNEPEQMPSFKHPMPPMETSTELKPSRPAKPSHESKLSHAHTSPAPVTTEQHQTWKDWRTTTQTQTWNYTFTHNHTWTTTATGNCTTTTVAQNSTSPSVNTSPTTPAPQPGKTWFPLMARVANQDNILGANSLRSAYTFVDFDGRRVYLGQAVSRGSRSDQRRVPFVNAQEEQKFFNPPLNSGLPRKLAQQQDPSLGVATVSTIATVTTPDATITILDQDGKSTREVVFDGTNIIETRTLTSETSAMEATSVLPEATSATTETGLPGQGIRHGAGWLAAIVAGLSIVTVIVGL